MANRQPWLISWAGGANELLELLQAVLTDALLDALGCCPALWPFSHGLLSWATIICCMRVLQVDLWDHNRSEPVASFQWGSDTVVSVRFNPAEPDLIASTASDRSLALYDLRSSTPVRKLIMQVCPSDPG